MWNCEQLSGHQGYFTYRTLGSLCFADAFCGLLHLLEWWEILSLRMTLVLQSLQWYFCLGKCFIIYTAVKSWSHWVVRAASHCPSWQRWLFDALWDTHMVMITLVHVIFLFGLARTKIMLSSKCYCGAFSAISWISNFCCRLTIQNERKRRSTKLSNLWPIRRHYCKWFPNACIRWHHKDSCQTPLR
jgi:hypothetical protein